MPITPRDVWLDKDSFATTLFTLIIDEYVMGAQEADEIDPQEWDPETIALEIEDDHKIELPQLVHDRLMVAFRLRQSDEFYKSLPDFISYCNILAGTPAGPQFDPADSLEIAWGITEALFLAPPPEDDENPFSEEITAYIGKVLDEEGIMNAPDILAIATRGEPLVDVQGEFSDDPEMFNAIYDAEASKTEDINNAVRRSLIALTHQLRNLPLQHGKSVKVQQMFQSLEEPVQASPSTADDRALRKFIF
jgi:hypothetical protein